MNRGAIAEMAERSTPRWSSSRATSRPPAPRRVRPRSSSLRRGFGDRLHLRAGQPRLLPRRGLRLRRARCWSTLPGVTLAVLDTSSPGPRRRRRRADQLEWLDELRRRGRPPGAGVRPPPPVEPRRASGPTHYFGINPDDSERLVEVVARRPASRLLRRPHPPEPGAPLRGHRRRPLGRGGLRQGLPGAWAEYRVYEGGILQVFRRISAPEALVWSERTRHMYAGLYGDYAFGASTTAASSFAPGPFLDSLWRRSAERRRGTAARPGGTTRRPGTTDTATPTAARHGHPPGVAVVCAGASNNDEVPEVQRVRDHAGDRRPTRARRDPAPASRRGRARTTASTPTDAPNTTTVESHPCTRARRPAPCTVIADARRTASTPTAPAAAATRPPDQPAPAG